jgi:predicted transcriptional regulator
MENDGVVEKASGASTDMVTMTADVVAAYVAHNSLPSSALADLIHQVHATLKQVASGANEPVEQPLTPAVPIKKSVTRDYIVCLEDGKRFKSLKRHLRSAFNLSPEEYRKKWGLPFDYPMVAPNYAETRSALAKNMGLGNMRPKGRAKGADKKGKSAPARKGRSAR